MSAPDQPSSRTDTEPAPFSDTVTPSAGAGAGDEQSAQHGKRALMVAVLLGGLVVGGLLVDAFRTPAQPAKAVDTQAKPAPPQDAFIDFEAKQRMEAARLEAERQRRAALDAQRGIKPPEEQVDGAPRPKTPEQELRDAARLDDLKRALAAIKSQDMVIERARGDAADAPGPAASASASRGEATLSRLRHAIERVKGGGSGASLASDPGGAGGGSVSAEGAGGGGRWLGASATGFARDIPGAQAASTVVGQSATRRRERGEPPREGEYLVPVGTVMAAVLDMEVNSDWEGRWRAMIARDIYDINQDVILIPKGTRVLGTSVRPKPVNEAINERMALAAQWLVLPNGARIDLTRSSMLDAGGVAAIDGDVNRHFLATLGGVVAYGVIGGWGAAEAVKRTDSNTAVAAASVIGGGRTAGAEIALGLADIGKRVASRYLNLVPTITIQPGTPMNVFLDDEMVLQAWAPIDEFAPAVTRP